MLREAVRLPQSYCRCPAGLHSLNGRAFVDVAASQCGTGRPRDRHALSRPSTPAFVIKKACLRRLQQRTPCSTPMAGKLPAGALGETGIQVPKLCFGTMLFGESTEWPEAQKLMDESYERGVTFFDSAEMYPVPQTAHKQGLSEEWLGRWMRQHPRDAVIVATKVAGPSGQMTWLRGGPPALDAHNIMAALDGSLRRLGTDYVDLYQLHWPDRYVPMFGGLDYDPRCAYQSVPLEEQLGALADAMRAGKVRAIGLSNETPWGMMRCLQLAEKDPTLPRVATIQNAYSLLCRTFDIALAECCFIERVRLLAYSPLAMGLLTGKYQAPGGGPPEARLNRYRGRYAEAESRYGPKPNVNDAVQAYVALARQAGMKPTEMALRFVLSHELLASAVIGATSVHQLTEQLDAAAAGALPESLLQEIDSIHARYPNPTP